ncbi:hypothetical protein BTVI_83379 [Pitangus sulphuratus]|nr:hypothetical protein BTVI_83379 [Pitangus sulphuratus]
MKLGAHTEELGFSTTVQQLTVCINDLNGGPESGLSRFRGNPTLEKEINTPEDSVSILSNFKRQENCFDGKLMKISQDDFKLRAKLQIFAEVYMRPLNSKLHN